MNHDSKEGREDHMNQTAAELRTGRADAARVRAQQDDQPTNKDSIDSGEQVAA